MSTKAIAPIRVIMFTAESCRYCKPVEKIVMELGAEVGDLIHATTIDVDVHPDAEEQFKVRKLPTLTINDEVLLQGEFINEDAVKDILWNAILNHAASTKKLNVKLRETLLNYTMATNDALSGITLLRPSIGDFTHIGVYQLILLNLYSLDPLIPYILYQTGHKLGEFGIMHYILSTLNSKLGMTSKRTLKFRQLGRAFEMYFSTRADYSTLAAESAKVVEVTNSTIHLKVNELASAAIGTNVGEPLCSFTAGQLAGVTNLIMGTEASCEEQICAANGGDFCLFKISIDSDYTEITPPPIITKAERNERKQAFYETIHEISQIHEKSLLMRAVLRPKAGDFIHISVIQPIIIVLKLVDRLSPLLLYSGGRELGVFGPGKDLITQLLDEKQVMAPVDIDMGMELIYEYLTHPSSFISRDYGRIHLWEENNKYYLEIEELSTSAGMNNANLNSTFCSFHTGFIAGRLHILIGREPSVKEIKCQGTGHKSCVFEISIMDQTS